MKILLAGQVAILGTMLVLSASGRGLQKTESLDAAAIVRQAVQRRTEQEKTHQPLRFELRKKDQRRDTTKIIIETKDGNVARLIAVDGKPLSPVAEADEIARLDTLAAHPEQQEKRHRSELEDAKRVSALLKLLPDAMTYTIEGTEACGNGECYRMSFRPKRGWSGPALESDLLRGVAGEIWVDKKQQQLVRLNANFIADVNFGLGLLAKLYRGSTAQMEQPDVGLEIRHGKQDWELTRMALDINGKALLFKAVDVKTVEQTSHFAEVSSELDYRDAIRMLKQDGGSR